MGSQSAERLLLCDEIYLCDLRECARLKTKKGKRKVESVGSGCSLTNFPCYEQRGIPRWEVCPEWPDPGVWEERTTSSQAHMVRWRPALSENVAMAITPLSQAQKCRERAIQYARCVYCTFTALYGQWSMLFMRATHMGAWTVRVPRIPYTALTSRGFDEVRPRPLRGPRTSNFDEISTWGSIRTRPEPRLEPSSFRTSSANTALRNARTAPRFVRRLEGGESFGAGFAD